MRRRIVEDQAGWVVEETIAGAPSRAYYFREQLAIRVPLDSKIARRLGGLTLIEKDLRTIKAWIGALGKLLLPLGAGVDVTTPGFMPTDDPDKLASINIARALYLAIVTTYGKLFTSADGRGTSLQQKDVVPDQYKEAHQYLMHTRHNFAAHSGADGPEGCQIILAIDYSRRNRTPPRVFTELHQPTTVGLPELREIEALVEHLQARVSKDIQKSTAATYDEVRRIFDNERLFFLRKGAPGTFLKRSTADDA
jgi:hypothetical protein